MKQDNIISKTLASIKGLDQRPSQVDLIPRLSAYIADWFFGNLFVMAGPFVMFSLMTAKEASYKNLYSFPAYGLAETWSYLSFILALIFYCLYFVFIPYKVWPGQTLGKKMTKLKIVEAEDYETTSWQALLMRHLVGFVVVEGAAFTMGQYLQETLSLMTGYYTENYLGTAGLIFAVVSLILVIFTSSGRALHDYLANTRVIKIEGEEPVKKLIRDQRRRNHQLRHLKK